MANIENCSKGLLNWSRRSFRNIKLAIGKMQKELEMLNQLPCTAKERKLKLELEGMLDRKEPLWKQRAKTQWLAGGDRNTRFFHSQASKRAQ